MAIIVMLVGFLVPVPEPIAIRIPEPVIHRRMPKFMVPVGIGSKPTMHVVESRMHAIPMTLLAGIVVPVPTAVAVMVLAAVILNSRGGACGGGLCMGNLYAAVTSECEWKNKH